MPLILIHLLSVEHLPNYAAYDDSKDTVVLKHYFIISCKRNAFKYHTSFSLLENGVVLYLIFPLTRSHKVLIIVPHPCPNVPSLTAESSALMRPFRWQSIAQSTSLTWVFLLFFSFDVIFRILHANEDVLNVLFFWFLWQDSSQMLFRSCGAIVHDNECREPVINFSEDTRCVYHTMMPSMPPPPLKDQVVTYSSTQFAYFCFWFNFDLYFYKRFKWSTLLLFMWMMK